MNLKLLCNKTCGHGVRITRWALVALDALNIRASLSTQSCGTEEVKIYDLYNMNLREGGSPSEGPINMGIE